MTHDITPEAVEVLAKRLHTDNGFLSAAQLAASTPLEDLPSANELEDICPEDATLGDYPIILGRGDYPTLRQIVDKERWLMCDAAASLRALSARIAELEKGLI
jgi:hypothetical protein